MSIFLIKGRVIHVGVVKTLELISLLAALPWVTSLSTHTPPLIFPIESTTGSC